MTTKQTDLMSLQVAFWDYKDDKNVILMQFARGMIDIQTYNQEMDLLDGRMNAHQFRYINKYKVKAHGLTTKVFDLSPDDLQKFNYN